MANSGVSIVATLLAVLANSNISAMDFSIDTAVTMTSKYVNCQPKAKKIVELATKFVAASDQEKPALLAEIRKQKKNLKKCEKKNKKDSRKRINITNLQLSSTFHF